MIREKELRLALICYGGVSLAVYMHGVTKELWKLLKASEARKCGRAGNSRPHEDGHQLVGDSEAVWHEFLAEIGKTTDLSVICDILAGASAGGLNTVLLSNALALGHDLEPLTAMWLEEADVEHLLDPDARKSAFSQRLAQFYKEPVAWFAARQSASLASVDVPEVRAEVALKLARFVRSRWFKPPFSGDVLTAMLDKAMDAMEAGTRGPSLVPPTLPLDLYVTVTDYWGVNSDLAIHSPPTVTEREHRRLFAFASPAVTRRHGAARDAALPPREATGERPALLLAARATASFPGAFPPATIGEVDRRMTARGEPWPGRAAFLAAQLPSDRPAEEIALIDGSVLNNAPFGPAIAAIRTRPAHREVDRRFVYVDPKPGLDGPSDAFDTRAPGFFTTMFRALADIPREQPIRDSLEAINQLSARIRRVRSVTDAMTPAVDAAILRAVGARLFLLPVNGERLAKARARIQSQAAREAGFAFAAYAQLKLRAVLDEASALLAASAGLGPVEARTLRRRLETTATARGAFAHDDAIGREAESCGYVRLLKQLDLGFRVRRLRFFIRRLNGVIEASRSPAEWASAERLKAAMYNAVSPYEARRGLLTPAFGEPVQALLSAATHEAVVAAGGRVIDALATTLGLSALDAEADQMLVAAAMEPGFTRPVRRALIRAWLGFPFYDIAILPLLQESAADSFEELKVDRISPDDAVALRPGGARMTLKGWQLNAFAAFFSRAYRENDYLWGRLHAAERLVDIVLSAVPDAGLDARHWKGLLFGAILATERSQLTRIEPLFDELEGALQSWTAGAPQEGATQGAATQAGAAH
jgi:patatin-related protein